MKFYWLLEVHYLHQPKSGASLCQKASEAEWVHRNRLRPCTTRPKNVGEGSIWIRRWTRNHTVLDWWKKNASKRICRNHGVYHFFQMSRHFRSKWFGRSSGRLHENLQHQSSDQKNRGVEDNPDAEYPTSEFPIPPHLTFPSRADGRGTLAEGAWTDNGEGRSDGWWFSWCCDVKGKHFRVRGWWKCFWVGFGLHWTS